MLFSPFPFTMIQLPKADSECFPSPDMEQVVIGIIELSSRFRCQLKCNCYTSLIDLNNLFNEFIYILLVMIYNVLAIILQKRVQIKLNNCTSVSKSCYISTAKRVTWFFSNQRKKKNPINIQNTALTLKPIVTRGEKSKKVFSQNSTNYRITKTSGHIYSII